MKTVNYISLLTVLVMLLSVFCIPVAAFASDNVTTSNITATATPEPTPEPVPADTITITTEYPKIESVASSNFEFNVTLNYKGTINRVFDLKASVPSNWEVYIEPSYETGKKISSISIDSSYSGMTKNIKVVAKAPSYPLPDPGDYKILIQATSGNVTGSLELAARIAAKYAIYVVPVNQLYNTSAQAGKNNIYSIQISNTGTATLDNITLTSTHPDGWEIKYTPDKVEILKASETKNIDINIKPPPKTVAGDYMITLQIAGKQVTAENMQVRVMVKTPTIWGWVSVLIILVVVVGLYFLIMRFGRR
jgi:uncharacterized membrane protein